MASRSRPRQNRRRVPAAQPWQLAGAESQKSRIALKVDSAISKLTDKLKEGTIKAPLTVTDVLREEKIDRKSLQRDYHATSFAKVVAFVASTSGSPQASNVPHRAPKTTSYYRAMRNYAAAAAGAKLEVTRLTKLLDEARSEIARLTRAQERGSKAEEQKKAA